jgi:hypothetical protein
MTVQDVKRHDQIAGVLRRRFVPDCGSLSSTSQRHLPDEDYCDVRASNLAAARTVVLQQFCTYTD